MTILFGKSKDEIGRMILELERYKEIESRGWIKYPEEKKMTRQEAIEVVQKHLDPNNEVGNNIVNALEALGLIKFEEEKVWGYPEDLLRTVKECRLSYTETEDFLYALEKRGYKVTKK